MSHNSPPPGACDCHVHVIGPKKLFPLAANRAYTPPDAPLEALERMLARLGLDGVVLVQPSIYATDNSCMLTALARLGARARAVAVLPETTTPVEADRLEAAGVRGLRVNVVSGGVRPADQLKRQLGTAAEIGARNGWHIQLFIQPAALEGIATFLAELPVDIVLDHFGLLTAKHLGSAEERTVLGLLETGRVWVKLSAPYRIAADPSESWIGEVARRILRANPERVVWGSDWPHTPQHGAGVMAGDQETPYRDIDTTGLLAAFGRWIEEASHRRQILVVNPARLYRFA